MSEIAIGQVIKTDGLRTVKVLEKLGEGGQGIVYKVECDGKEKALKWYFKHKLQDAKGFYRSIKKNIEAGKPSNAFLWPEDITEKVGGTFGYIMPLRPKGYEDFSKYLLARVGFKSVQAMINAVLNIVNGFDTLHKKGYNYQDLNDGNFFVNFDTGDVLICDNDNVRGHGYKSGIAGKCRYMAPEVVCGKAPDKTTDRYSLAVVIFLLLFVNHPLEGKGTNPPCLTEELERKYYGENPIFIYDENDNSNRPIPGIHSNVIKKWQIFPQYVRDAFLAAFSKGQMSGKDKRYRDSEWIKLFIQLRSDLITCSCREEIFADISTPVKCTKCGQEIRIPAYIKIKNQNIPLFPRTNLYSYHTIDGSEDYSTPTADVILSKKNPGSMGLRNLSDITWYVSGADGKSVPKGKGEVVKVANGLKIDFGKALTAEIIGN